MPLTAHALLATWTSREDVLETTSMDLTMKIGEGKLLTSLLFLASISTPAIHGHVLIKGNITLGALVPIHAHQSNLNCGKIQERLGIQRLEGIMHAIDRVNEDDTILKDLILGLEAYDTCASETIALDRALDFIRGDLSSKRTVRSIGRLQEVAGVLGPLFSSVSIQVAHLFRLFEMPQVSFESTSYELSDKSRFEFFSRIVPHDLYQAKAIIDVARYLGWTYLSVVYSDDSYGLLGVQALRKEAKKAGACIAATEKLEQAKPYEEYSKTVDNLLEQREAKCVVVFCSQESQIRNLLRAVKEKNIPGRFQWLGSDGWGNVVWLKGLEEVAASAITISPKSVQVKSFEEYYMNLHPTTNARNPWFEEYWEEHFDCQFKESKATPSPRTCNNSFQLNPSNTELDVRAASAMDAVYVFAHALDAMQKDLCSVTGVLCDRMRNLSGRVLLSYIRNVSFAGVTGDTVRFDANGDVDGKYDVLLFKETAPGVYGNVHVADWSTELKVNPGERALIEEMRLVKSTCTAPCSANEVRVPVKGRENCCWTCTVCNGNSYINTNGTECIKCPLGYKTTPTRDGCSEIALLYFGVDFKFSIPAMALSGLGILLTVFVMGVFGKHNRTPIVKASGRELSYLLLCGILLCFIMTFVTAIRPSDITCIARFFGNGVTFTVCYASLFIKANRISRIFNRKNLTRRPSLILPSSQLVLVVGVVAVEVLILLMLTLLHTPRAQTFYPTDTSTYLDCSTSDFDFGLSQVYNFILICMCTVYAFKTRKIPNNFNEAKFIAFAMYSSCVLWLAFLAVFYMDQTHRQKPVIVCISVSLIAFVLLCCMYGPKVYIILLRPHRNVRKRVLPSLSLSSLSQSNRGSHKTSFRINTGDMDEPLDSSGDDILDKRRRPFDFNRPQSQISGDDPKDVATNDRIEVEKLILQLKKELRWTREALMNAQVPLRQRRVSGRNQELMREHDESGGEGMKELLLHENGCETDSFDACTDVTASLDVKTQPKSQILEGDCTSSTPLLNSTAAPKTSAHRDSGIDTASSESYNSKPTGTEGLDQEGLFHDGTLVQEEPVETLKGTYPIAPSNNLAWNRRSKSLSDINNVNGSLLTKSPGKCSGSSGIIIESRQPIQNARDSVGSRDSRVLNTAL